MAEPEWKKLAIPDVDSRWDRMHAAHTRTVRVMGHAEGYVIARHSGRIPFVTHMSDWYKIFTPKVMPKRQRKGIEKPMAGAVGQSRSPSDG